MTARRSVAQVARVVHDSLQRGIPIRIEGLGVFRPNGKGKFDFFAETAPRVFIAYAEEDYQPALRFFRDLTQVGYRPWLDRMWLRPGQNWPRAIERAIGISDFVIACFSRQSVMKRGHFQSELRYALDCASRLPIDDIFLIPVRLDDCVVPLPIRRQLQYVDMFPDWSEGLARVVSALASRGRK